MIKWFPLCLNAYHSQIFIPLYFAEINIDFSLSQLTTDPGPGHGIPQKFWDGRCRQFVRENRGQNWEIQGNVSIIIFFYWITLLSLTWLHPIFSCRAEIEARIGQLKARLDDSEKRLLDSLDETCLQLGEKIQAASTDEIKDVDLKELLDIVNIRSGVKL